MKNQRSMILSLKLAAGAILGLALSLATVVALVGGLSGCGAAEPTATATPDAGPDLDEQKVPAVGPVHPVLPDGHDVDVVLHQDRQVPEARLEVVGHGETVPAGHDGGADGLSGGEVHGSRHPDAHTPHVGFLAADLRQKLREHPLRPTQHELGS